MKHFLNISDQGFNLSTLNDVCDAYSIEKQIYQKGGHLN